MGACERTQTMHQLSKLKHSCNQWQAKAKQRSDHYRDLRKQLARIGYPLKAGQLGVGQVR
jgi:hypothetical protein